MFLMLRRTGSITDRFGKYDILNVFRGGENCGRGGLGTFTSAWLMGDWFIQNSAIIATYLMSMNFDVRTPEMFKWHA